MKYCVVDRNILIGIKLSWVFISPKYAWAGFNDASLMIDDWMKIVSLLVLYLYCIGPMPEVARKELLFLGTQLSFWKSPSFEALHVG